MAKLRREIADDEDRARHQAPAAPPQRGAVGRDRRLHQRRQVLAAQPADRRRRARRERAVRHARPDGPPRAHARRPRRSRSPTPSASSGTCRTSWSRRSARRSRRSPTPTSILHVVDGSHPDPESQLAAVRAGARRHRRPRRPRARRHQQGRHRRPARARPAAAPREAQRRRLGPDRRGHRRAARARSTATCRAPTSRSTSWCPTTGATWSPGSHATGEVLSVEHTDDGTPLHARVGPALAAELAPFATAPTPEPSASARRPARSGTLGRTGEQLTLGRRPHAHPRADDEPQVEHLTSRLTSRAAALVALRRRCPLLQLLVGAASSAARPAFVAGRDTCYLRRAWSTPACVLPLRGARRRRRRAPRLACVHHRLRADDRRLDLRRRRSPARRSRRPRALRRVRPPRCRAVPDPAACSELPKGPHARVVLAERRSTRATVADLLPARRVGGLPRHAARRSDGSTASLHGRPSARSTRCSRRAPSWRWSPAATAAASRCAGCSHVHARRAAHRARRLRPCR